MGTNSGGFVIPEIHVYPPSPMIVAKVSPETQIGGGQGLQRERVAPGQNQNGNLLTVPQRADHFLYNNARGKQPKCSGKCRLAEARKLAPNQTLYVRGSPELRRAHPRLGRTDDSPYIDPIDALRSNTAANLADETRYTEPYNSRSNSAYRLRNAGRSPKPQRRPRNVNGGPEDVSNGRVTLRPHQCVCRCGRVSVAAVQEEGGAGGSLAGAGEGGVSRNGHTLNPPNCDREVSPEEHEYNEAQPTDPSLCEPYMVTSMTTIHQALQPSWNDVMSSAGNHGNVSEENNQYEIIPEHTGLDALLQNRIDMNAGCDMGENDNKLHFFFLILFILLFVAGMVCLILRFSTSTFQTQGAYISPEVLQVIP